MDLFNEAVRLLKLHVEWSDLEKLDVGEWRKEDISELI